MTIPRSAQTQCPKGNATLARLSPCSGGSPRGQHEPQASQRTAKGRKNRPTKVALREMAKIRKVLGLPRLPEPI